MIPTVIPLATEIAADFGIGYIVHGGVSSSTCYQSLNLAKKACVGIAELAIVGIACDNVNAYIDDQYEKLGKFLVRHDLDKKFMRKETKK